MVVVGFLLAVDVDLVAVDSDADVVAEPPMEPCVVPLITKVDPLLNVFDPTGVGKVVVDMLPLPMEVDVVADVLGYGYGNYNNCGHGYGHGPGGYSGNGFAGGRGGFGRGNGHGPPRGRGQEARALAADPGYAHRNPRSTRSGGVYVVEGNEAPAESFDSGDQTQASDPPQDPTSHSEEMCYGEGENGDDYDPYGGYECGYNDQCEG